MVSAWLRASAIALAMLAQILQASANEPLRADDPSAQIEQRLIDLQVQVATVRSLTGPAANTLADTLEGELASLAREYRKLSGRPSSIRPRATTALAPGVAVPIAQRSVGGTTVERPGASSSWFGSTTTVTPGPAARPQPQPQPTYGDGGTGELPRNNAFSSHGIRDDRAVTNWARQSGRLTAPSAAGESLDADRAYQTAYNYLLQQDYGAANTAFTEYLLRYPDTPLAANAQYWLGETHYVNGDYKAAAVAFLKGYEKYGNGSKGPDSLLKLALSLAKLKQVDAACSSLRQLGGRYPAAPQPMLNRARAEMRRLRCPG